MQTLVYLPVKQEANIQVSVEAFKHVHQQDHYWHINKQIGTVLRTLDRGAAAADNLVGVVILFDSPDVVALQVVFLVLTLIPGLLECASVCVIFILHFQRFELSLVMFVGILLYVWVTRSITLKRKRIRYCMHITTADANIL